MDCPWKYHLPIVWWDCSQSGNYHPLSTDCILNLCWWLYYHREQKHECFKTESSEQDRKLGDSANRNFSCLLGFYSFLLSSSLLSQEQCQHILLIPRKRLALILEAKMSLAPGHPYCLLEGVASIPPSAPPGPGCSCTQPCSALVKERSTVVHCDQLGRSHSSPSETKGQKHSNRFAKVFLQEWIRRGRQAKHFSGAGSSFFFLLGKSVCLCDF